MKLIRYLALALVVLLSASCFRKGGSGDTTSAATGQKSDWRFGATPVWAEEFNYKGQPDSARWGYDLGGSGWGNNELQYYTASLRNASVDGGKLTITARRESYEGKGYTSARLQTKGKGDFLYGRIEVRAKLPSGRGTWPAIWMLPTDWAYGGWPRSGEIDIMEHVGYDPNNVLFSVHTEAYNHLKGTQKSGGKTIATAMTEFHTYRTDWTPDAVRGYFDGELVFTFLKEDNGPSTWPFDKRFHLLLNLAIGGNWGGAKGVDDTIFPATFEIDYVRVYPLLQ